MHSRVPQQLVSSLQQTPDAWQSALGLFRRSLIEAGTTFGIEHSQRLGLLFSKNVGQSEEVKKWASLFNAEDIPTCSMMLKALVRHGHWKTAVSLFEWSADSPSFGQLGEHLAQFMLTEGLERESLEIVQTMLKTPEFNEQPPRDSQHQLATPSIVGENGLTFSVTEEEKTLMDHVISDIIGLAENPTYVPAEEEGCYCGLGRAVLRAFPKNSQWKEASAMLNSLGLRMGGKAKIRLAEYEYARRVYGGRQYEAAHYALKNNAMTSQSATLQRVLLYSSVEMTDIDTAMQCLESLTALGQQCVPLVSLERFCHLFIRAYSNGTITPDIERRFVQIILPNYSKIHSPETRVAIAKFFSERQIVTPFSQGVPSPRHPVCADPAEKSSFDGTNSSSGDTSAGMSSITEYDQQSTLLIQQGKWKEALAILEKLSNTEPKNERERVIHETVLQCGDDWQRALQFFS